MNNQTMPKNTSEYKDPIAQYQQLSKYYLKKAKEMSIIVDTDLIEILEQMAFRLHSEIVDKERRIRIIESIIQDLNSPSGPPN